MQLQQKKSHPLKVAPDEGTRPQAGTLHAQKPPAECAVRAVVTAEMARTRPQPPRKEEGTLANSRVPALRSCLFLAAHTQHLR